MTFHKIMLNVKEINMTSFL